MKHKKKQNALLTKQFKSHLLNKMKSQKFIDKMKSQNPCLFIGKNKKNHQNKT
jgi:hypothetical protein